ncbi:hypothetical protein QTH27_03295 [Clostridium perfringens]|uniref:hypothetical protein n=1 Tax=Clostridium perfringens TaxID=1502 RepID=UPI0018E45471|nr:hypothetical protein [Clostridium perfringens]MDH5060782.1 hypothetical protein [Clostridium perfringens NCTC 8239]MBI6040201.1 hypothetical protein [Clostridium perfringens]MDM0470980.1 hypothetical protein [Clostridium perfringens]MDM0476807.1 hypothetical protein [Clostridium perfringens]MDM0485052.1 hypothetical protein [Clostridium perfringens]
MKSKNTNLIYLALGAFMLVLLQSNIFLESLWFIAQIPIPYLGEITILLSKILSFIGAILFIFVSLKLIKINFKNKES